VAKPVDALSPTVVPQSASDTSSHADSTVPTQPSPIPSTSGPPARRMAESSGFGDFALLDEIGRGGMGVVYKAHQKSLDRIVAIKMLRDEQYKDPAWIRRFQDEARAAARLGHPNIVAIYQVGECPAGHYLAMEFIEGLSLEELLAKGPLSPVLAATFLIPVAEAVHFAHTKGIVHRDLKPANIMIDRFRRPIVMDFGLAKFLEHSNTMTQGQAMGTPAYMAPEQASEGLGTVGPHSDVYSLGAVMYALLTGRPPYDGPSAISTALKVIAPEPPASVRSLKPDVPAELERICMKCLSKPTADRYSSAQGLAQALKRFRQRAVSGKPALPRVTLVAQTTRKEVRLAKAKSVIGRGAGCDVIIRSANVSKRHCQILIEPNHVVVEDLGSSNGTFVNGERTQHARLRDGYSLGIAEHRFEVHLEDSHGGTR
jgi:serine/threonine protein kinase